MISIKQIFLTNAAREVLASRYLNEEINEINSALSQIKDASEIDPDTLSRIIDLEKKRKKLKELLRVYRKVNRIKARITIIKAKSFIKRMFDSFGEFSKKALAIYGFCRILFDFVDQISKLIHKKRAIMAHFFIVYALFKELDLPSSVRWFGGRAQAFKFV